MSEGMLAHFDQCVFGLATPHTRQPIRKPTTFLSNSSTIHFAFDNMRCECEVQHHRLVGSMAGRTLSAFAQVYPPGLCDAIADAVMLASDLEPSHCLSRSKT